MTSTVQSSRTLTAQLNANDTIGALLARVRAAVPDADGAAPRLLMVAPPGLSLSEIDLRVLRREASAAGVPLALVTSDPVLRARSAREGISTFRTEARALRSRWRRLPSDPAPGGPPGGEANVVAPYAAGLFHKRSPTRFRPAPFDRAFSRSPSPWWATLTLALVLAALLAALAGAFVLVIPSATITLSSASEATEVVVPLLAVQNAEADPDAGVVPARVVSTQVSGEGRTQTTGRSQEAAGKARGQVMFINRTSAPVTVPAGTIVSTATGNNAQFVTTLDAPLAPSGRAEVPAEAVLPGPTGNARAGTITRVDGPLALSVLATNNTATAGGTTAQVGVVSEEDKERLQAELFAKLKEQAYADLNEKLEPGSFIPPETVTYLALSPTFTPFVGEVSPDLFLNMSVQAVGLVVDTEAGKTVALKRIQDSMPPGTRLISDTLRYIPGGISVVDPQTVGFSITADGSLLSAIDAGAVRNAVLGLKPEEASKALMERFELAQPPDIRLGPDWLPYIVPTNLPMVPWRIRVVVDWDSAAQLAQQR
jgi:hypothetical protein